MSSGTYWRRRSWRLRAHRRNTARIPSQSFSETFAGRRCDDGCSRSVPDNSRADHATNGSDESQVEVRAKSHAFVSWSEIQLDSVFTFCQRFQENLIVSGLSLSPSPPPRFSGRNGSLVLLRASPAADLSALSGVVPCAMFFRASSSVRAARLAADAPSMRPFSCVKLTTSRTEAGTSRSTGFRRLLPARP